METEKWLKRFIIGAIEEGFSNHIGFVSEDICRELVAAGVIQRSRMNDEDDVWDGEVMLDGEFAVKIKHDLIDTQVLWRLESFMEVGGKPIQRERGGE